MSAITDKEEEVAELRTAYLAALKKKSYTINSGGNSRTFTAQDVKILKELLNVAIKELQILKGETRRVRVGTPTCRY
jgi:hypothetical protein